MSTSSHSNTRHVLLALLLLSMALAGCGGSSSTVQRSPGGEAAPTPTPAPTADHQDATFIRGVVTGSNTENNTIQVGEDEIALAGAPVTENGVITPDAQPKIGQTVNLFVARGASGERFVAQAIDVSLVAKGPIESVNTANSTFTLLGQTISYSTTTVYAGFPSSGTQLTADMMVAVSGSVTGAGRINATRIEYLGANYSAASGIQVSGIAENVDTTARTFRLGNLTINYSLVPASAVTALANGAMVIVRNTVLPLNGTFTAGEISVSAANPPPTSSLIDTTIALRGPIDQVNTTNRTMTILGQTVTYSASTPFVTSTGGTFTPATGNVVKVTATPNTPGNDFVATRVELVSATYTSGTPVQVSGTVSNLNANARTFQLGQLTVNYSSVANLGFTLADGMKVIAAANAAPSGNTFTVTELRQASSNTNPPGGGDLEAGIAIKGPIEQVDTGASTFTIMGQTVTYNAQTQFPSGNANTLVVGYVVRVTATPGSTAGTFNASRVELVGTSYTAGTLVQISGTIQNLDTNARTFRLGNLTVNYGSITNLGLSPANGMQVVVGALSIPVSNVLTATVVTTSGGGTPCTPGTPGCDPGGGIDMGTAIRGPVESIDVGASTFVVLGQTVTFNSSTQFVTPGGGTFVLANGNYVRVVAAANTTGGQLLATRVELLGASYTAGSPLQITGTIQNLNATARTFTLGSLTVNYSAVTNLNFTPAVGMTVTVAATALPTGNVLNATAMAAVTPGPGPGPGPVVPTQPTIAVVSGIIATVNGTTEFNLTGVTVRVSQTTQYLNGSQALLVPGVSVMVVGTLSGGLPNAILDARLISFAGTPTPAASRVMIRGPVESIDLLNGRLVVMGITVIAPRSSIVVRDDDPDRSITLADLQPGMVVTVAGVGAPGQIAANFLALARNNGQTNSGDDDDDDAVDSRLPSVGMPLIGDVPNPGVEGVRAWLWAPVDAVAAPNLTAFGIPIVTTENTAFFPAGHNTRARNPDTFFASVTAGRTVRAEGVYANGSFVATRVCIVGSSAQGGGNASGAAVTTNEDDN